MQIQRTVYFLPSADDKLRAYAYALGMTKSELISQMILEALNNPCEYPPPKERDVEAMVPRTVLLTPEVDEVLRQASDNRMSTVAFVIRRCVMQELSKMAGLTAVDLMMMMKI